MAMRIRMASPAASLNVSVVSSASPSVAVRPGSMPTAMPRSVAHATLNRVLQVAIVTIAPKKCVRPSNTRALLGKTDQEDTFEHEAYGKRDHRPLENGEGDDARQALPALRRAGLEQHDEAGDEQEGGPAEGEPADQDEAVAQRRGDRQRQTYGMGLGARRGGGFRRPPRPQRPDEHDHAEERQDHPQHAR